MVWKPKPPKPAVSPEQADDLRITFRELLRLGEQLRLQRDEINHTIAVANQRIVRVQATMVAAGLASPTPAPRRDRAA